MNQNMLKKLSASGRVRTRPSPGLSVTLYDPDIVSGTNIGRQLFSDSDIGLNKAKCLITRVNNFFGNDWRAVPGIFPTVLKKARRDDMANITITCTDNISRYMLRVLLTMPRHFAAVLQNAASALFPERRKII